MIDLIKCKDCPDFKYKVSQIELCEKCIDEYSKKKLLNEESLFDVEQFDY